MSKRKSIKRKKKYLYAHFFKIRLPKKKLTSIVIKSVFVCVSDDRLETLISYIMRPPRAQSPRYGRRLTRHESLRQRLPDQHTNEIIHFVRELQFERQPTLLRLQKKTPLPGIGQSCAKAGSNDSGFLERGTDSNDSDDESLDNEIAQTQRKVVNPRLDPFIKEMLTCPRLSNTSNDYDVLSRSLARDHARNENQSKSTKQTASKLKKHKKCGDDCHGHTNVANQLPPLPREDIPERPSAPPPCRTPPASDSDFIEEENIDYLDLS